MGKIRHQVVVVDAAGVDGSASGNTDSDPILGELLACALKFSSAAPITTDVTLKATNPFDYTILSFSNQSTDVFVEPRMLPVSSANAAITNAHVPYLVNGPINVAVAQTNSAATLLTAHLWWRE